MSNYEVVLINALTHGAYGCNVRLNAISEITQFKRNENKTLKGIDSWA